MEVFETMGNMEVGGRYFKGGTMAQPHLQTSRNQDFPKSCSSILSIFLFLPSWLSPHVCNVAATSPGIMCSCQHPKQKLRPEAKDLIFRSSVF